MLELVESYLDKSGNVTLDADEVRRLVFCVYETRNSAKALNIAYYEAIEAK